MAETRRLWAIVPAAGRGERFASVNNLPKQYTPLLGSSVLEWSLRALLAEPRIHAIVVVLAAGDSHWPSVAARLNSPNIFTAIGGAQRQESVMNGLEFLASRAAADDWILVHDAARPCLSRRDIGALADALEHTSGDAAARIGGAVLAAPIVDTVKRECQSGVETVDRAGLWRALTPQVFSLAPLRRALEDAARLGVAVTDEAQAMERIGVSATLVAGSPFNIKITRAEDLSVAADILKMRESGQMRVGQGMDVHAFGEGDHVVLGGVRIAHNQGVVAHSDGDVVIHALCDALLGAMGDGDIGQHFPDTDPRYRGAASPSLRPMKPRRSVVVALMLISDAGTSRSAARFAAIAPRCAAMRGASASTVISAFTIVSPAAFIRCATTRRNTRLSAPR